MSFAPMPVRRPREQVESQLRAAILGGVFSDGSRLPSETDLAAQFGVSRSTIREALRTLASDGLVRKTPGAQGGTFVQLINASSLSDRLRESVDGLVRLGAVSLAEMIQLRHLLELPTAELAAKTRTAAQIEGIRESLTEADELPIADPKADRVHSNFHILIAQASGNRLASAFVAALHGVDVSIPTFTYPDDYDEQTRLQHHAIFEALEAGNSVSMREAMEAHLHYLEETHLGAR